MFVRSWRIDFHVSGCYWGLNPLCQPSDQSYAPNCGRCPDAGQRRLYGWGTQIQEAEYFLDDHGVPDAGDDFDGGAAF
ncbi:hypothetical protein N9H39_07360 [Gammaproteobacteria bacterium]|nr:hypothetical protein [Gammaproteobacteria bacterium]